MKDKIKLLVYPFVEKILFVVSHLIPIKKQIFFSSFSGKNCVDNPRYISIRFHELYPNYQQVWVKRKNYNINFPEYVKVVEWGSFNMILEMLRSKIWIDSHLKPLWIPKRKKQFYIETWHGGLGMKKIGFDSNKKIPELEKKTILHNTKMINLLISNSTWLSNIFRRSYLYNGQILKCGYPKVDAFMRDNEKTYFNVRKQLNLSAEAKIILYAPTFRDSEELDMYNIDLKKLINFVDNLNSDKWYLLVKLHPVVSLKSKSFFEFNDQIIDVTNFSDMQKLILATDIFITDYSSGIFDFALLKRPGFIYASDIEEYEKERGLYFDIKKMPFPFSSTTDELIKNIANFDSKKYLKNLNQYFDKVGLVQNGDSSDIICKIIIREIEK